MNKLIFPSLDKDSSIEISETTPLTELSTNAKNEWIGRISCEKCGRNELCVVANVDRNEICIIIQNFIDNIFLELNSIYEGKPIKEKSALLNGLYSLTQYAFENELYTGYFQKPHFISSVYAGDITEKVIGAIANIKRHGDDFLTQSKVIPELNSLSVVVLTEGASESEFVQNYLPFRSFDVEDYGGESNKKSKKLLPLMRYYQNRGYILFAQSDRDGKDIQDNGFHNYISNGEIDLKLENTFSFKHDLECSYPCNVLYHVLCEYGYIEESNITFDDFSSQIGEPVGIYGKLEELLDVTPSKVKLASIMASFIRKYALSEEESISASELGAFIKFLEKAEKEA